MPQPHQIFIAQEVFAGVAGGGPGVLGRLILTIGADGETRGADVFVVSPTPGFFQDRQRQRPGRQRLERGTEGAVEQFAALLGRGQAGRAVQRHAG